MIMIDSYDYIAGKVDFDSSHRIFMMLMYVGIVK